MRREAPVQTVLLHDMADVPGDVASAARAEVGRIFHRAHVRIEWLECPAASGPCPSRPPGTIILRIVPATLDYLEDRGALGYALLPGRAGIYATVSYGRVRLCALRQTASTASLPQILGHAMAHELGHMLLGPNSHSGAGLMRPVWDAAAFDDASKGRLNFLADEARRIELAVIQRTLAAAVTGSPARKP